MVKFVGCFGAVPQYWHKHPRLAERRQCVALRGACDFYNYCLGMECRNKRKDRHNVSFSRNCALLGIVEVMNYSIHCRFSDIFFANIGGGVIKKPNKFPTFFTKKLKKTALLPDAAVKPVSRQRNAYAGNGVQNPEAVGLRIVVNHHVAPDLPWVESVPPYFQ